MRGSIQTGSIVAAIAGISLVEVPPECRGYRDEDCNRRFMKRKASAKKRGKKH